MFVNPQNIKIECIYKSTSVNIYLYLWEYVLNENHINIYIPPRASPVCFRNRRQEILDTVQPSEDEVRKVIKFLDAIGFYLQ